MRDIGSVARHMRTMACGYPPNAATAGSVETQEPKTQEIEMKSKKLTFTAIAATLCLPLGALAGGDKSHADKKENYESTTASTESEHLNRPHMGADRYITENPEPGLLDDREADDTLAMSEENELATEWRSSSESRMQLTSSDIKTVEESELRDKLTADDLVGKTVVDSNGQEIGEVRAIALTSLNREQSRSSLNSGDSVASSPLSSREAEVHVYIERSDGDSLLEVPMSELSFDEQQDELNLDVAQSELESLTRDTVATTN